MSQGSSLTCGVTLEWQNHDKGVMRKANLKTVTLRLLRNEFREIFIAVYEKPGDSASKKFLLKNVAVHKKFANEGKTTISFQELKMSLLMYNAPPIQLVAFLKHMYIKMSGGNNGEKLKPRAKLLSSKAAVLEEISPVTLQDFNSVRKNKQTPDTTPPTGKKRTATGKLENSTVKRSCLSSYIDPAPLTSEQQNVLNLALSGRNLFFTGSAGTGKSYLLRRIIGALPPDVTFATASTGVAACHIGGMTLHSFSGIGRGQASVERCIQLASKSSAIQSWRRCKHLIIDEISMVHGSFFEKLEKVARAVRNNDRPFGGIQLILCGDFLQLPPVTKDSNDDDKRFCFQSPVWEQCIQASVELSKVHRQSDPTFIDILQNIRIGRVTEEITEKLAATSNQNINREGIIATRLCSHTKEADVINCNKLEALPGASKIFHAVDNDATASGQLDQLTRVPSVLLLKVGAQVMLMKNLNVAEGLVNGARGVVEKFQSDGLPVIHFLTKAKTSIQPERWTVKGSGNTLLCRKQLPLQLGWAFSIHKSQGLTLDCVEMSLGRVFEPGQAYVALSRAKSLNSLKVIDFNAKQVWANPIVLDFYRKFRRKMKMMEIVPLGKPK